MPQEKVSSWGDSVRTWASGYKDSVIVDMHYDNKTGFENIYVHKDHADSWKRNTDSQDSLAATNWQYWMVPTFFAIMATLIIFAFILYRDNNKALKETPKESILSRIKKSV
jgi:hypothetical protein